LATAHVGVKKRPPKVDASVKIILSSSVIHMSYNKYLTAAPVGGYPRTGAIWSISMSILVGRKSNCLLNLPQPSKQVRSQLQCADVTTTSGWLAMIVVGTQRKRLSIRISRPGWTHDPCRCLLTPNLARPQRIPLFVCAQNRDATAASSGVCGCRLSWRSARHISGR